MKCPKCELLTSDGKDECPRCQLDFRPYKERLGILAPARPSNKPSAESKQLDEVEPELPFEYFDDVVEVPKQETKPLQPKKIDLSDLIAGIEELRSDSDIPTSKPASVEEDNELQDLIEAIDTMGPGPDNADLSNSNLEALAPDAQRMFSEMNEGGELGGAGLQLFGDTQQSSPPPPTLSDLSHLLEEEEEEPAQNDLSELDDDALFAELASALESTVEEANVATSSIQDMAFPDTTSAATKKTESTPTVAPAVLEFGDDDALLEEQLDAMLGDELLDVQAVKVEKPKSTLASDDSSSMFLEDDLEISFEVEVEDDDDESPAPAATSAAEPESLLDGLLDSFNELDAECEQKDVLGRSVAEVNQETSSAAEDTLPELEETLREWDKSDSGDELSALHAELESELAALEAEGTSFLADSQSLLPVAEEPKVEEEPIDDELAALGAELGAELAALETEGTSFLGSSSDEAPAQDTDPELEDLSTELGAELAALESEGTPLLRIHLRLAAAEKDEVQSNDENREELADALSELLETEASFDTEEVSTAIASDLDFDIDESMELASDTEETLPLAGAAEEHEDADPLFESILGKLEEEADNDDEETIEIPRADISQQEELSLTDDLLDSDNSGEDDTDQHSLNFSEEEELEVEENTEETSSNEENLPLEDASQTGIFLASDFQNIIEEAAEQANINECEDSIALDDASQTGSFLASDLQSVIETAEDYAEEIDREDELDLNENHASLEDTEPSDNFLASDVDSLIEGESIEEEHSEPKPLAGSGDDALSESDLTEISAASMDAEPHANATLPDASQNRYFPSL